MCSIVRHSRITFLWINISFTCHSQANRKIFMLANIDIYINETKKEIWKGGKEIWGWGTVCTHLHTHASATAGARGYASKTVLGGVVGGAGLIAAGSLVLPVVRSARVPFKAGAKLSWSPAWPGPCVTGAGAKILRSLCVCVH